MTSQSHGFEPLLDPIDTFFCAAGDDERTLRKRIHKARDRASVCAWQHDRPEASRRIYLFAQQSADEWVFASATVAELRRVIRLLTGLFVAAKEAAELSRERRDQDGD